ncbi:MULTISPECIES: hypothetical protein [Rhodomicrobium]|uniref:hypothetical protein n=1 Tax=Rhodomicrobium TaxID=1068 RepID=UPI000B4B49E9|nr:MULTISPECIES: hypothetical protein [Rhodomicrobium]
MTYSGFLNLRLCYLLHCLRGSIAEKAIPFDHRSHPGARRWRADTTVVQGKVRRARPAQVLLDFYNHRSLFSNSEDTVDNLDAALRKRFSYVNIELKG